MNFTNRIRIAGALTMLGIAGFAGQLTARENVVTTSHREALKTTVTGCQPAVSAIDLDINNVRARLMTGGDMWWNIGLEVAAYEIPKGSKKSSQFAASCWIGGYDKQGQLKVAAQTYRQDGNDYWPGALDAQGKITSDVCANWDRFWKVDKSTINKFIELSKTGAATGSQFDVILQWPARGNDNVVGSTGSPLTLDSRNTYAPFVDVNNDGLYDPSGVTPDYPAISGDQFIWWVVNDAGNVKAQSQTAAMGIEVQNSAFAYATQDFLNNSTFYNYRVINRGALTIDSTYIAVWDDCDLGYYQDDFIGCDTFRGLGIMYNGSIADGSAAGFPVNSYGANAPQVGVDFFQGPKRLKKRPGLSDTTETLKMTNFTYYNNDNSVIGNPSNGVQIYNYMTGSIRNSDRFSNDFLGANQTSKGYGSGPTTNFVFTGDPGDKTTWSECTCGNPPGDRRFIFSSGPFQLLPGAANDITFGSVWASGVGGCPNTDFKTIKSIDDNAQGLFEAGFKTVEGPEAPRLVARELDGKIIFYIVNDYGSNNYAENYGRKDGSYMDSTRYHQLVTRAKSLNNPDSFYTFEGYRVFQLANSQVTSAEIFDPVTGQVDNSKAYEVFQCDVKNNVKKIINYSKLTSVSDSSWLPSIKVDGKDSGIKHSFVISQDQFSPSSDKSLVNYHNYYFVAIAYAHNDFAPFNSRFYNSTQDQPYIGSAHGAGGINIPVVECMPNPSNGAMGTTLNSEYGTGIAVTRVQGLGNGGNFVELSDKSTADALDPATGYFAGRATYKVNQGPVNIRVIDPVKVPAYDWVFQINGSVNNGSNALYTGNIDSTSGWILTAKSGGNVVDTIYSERDIHLLNEQIVEKYGLAISLNQVKAPGIEQAAGNGYIDSRITFEDPSKPWLWGVTDQPDSNFANWYRSGNNQNYKAPLLDLKKPCNFNDDKKLDTMLAYTDMLSNFTPVKNSWAPYYLAAYWVNGHAGTGTECGFEFAYNSNFQRAIYMIKLNDVNVVLTDDKSKWTKCAVIEMQEDSALSEGHAPKFSLRRHAGWDGQTSSEGGMVYSSDASAAGTSWFPGYAVDQVTGQRLNIVFGEDSYLSNDATSMAWYPDSRIFNTFDGSIVFGGKHAVYVLGSKYDEDKAFITLLRTNVSSNFNTAYGDFRWVGVPVLNPSLKLKSVKEGIIPTTTTLRFRVNRPYAPFYASDSSDMINVQGGKAKFPYYTFSTKEFAPTALNDNSDRKALLDKIQPVPNPYYGYSGFEASRYDTKVKIINLPANATVIIYSLDGTLVRTLTKSDPNNSYIDWDVRNAAGLPVASGMYLMHVKAEGIGETVLKWFGSTRPIDATSY